MGLVRVAIIGFSNGFRYFINQLKSVQPVFMLDKVMLGFPGGMANSPMVGMNTCMAGPMRVPSVCPIGGKSVSYNLAHVAAVVVSIVEAMAGTVFSGLQVALSKAEIQDCKYPSCVKLRNVCIEHAGSLTGCTSTAHMVPATLIAVVFTTGYTVAFS